jgi:hypothetical protein
LSTQSIFPCIKHISLTHSFNSTSVQGGFTDLQRFNSSVFRFKMMRQFYTALAVATHAGLNLAAPASAPACGAAPPPPAHPLGQPARPDYSWSPSPAEGVGTVRPPQPGPGSNPTPGPGNGPHHPPGNGPKPPTPGTPGPIYSNGTIECDVAILGGGASGSYAAIQLHRQNISVCVVEKRSVLGGTTNTYTLPTGETVDYGVMQWYDTPEIQDFFSYLSIESMASPYTLPPWAEADFLTGAPVETVDFVPALMNYVPTVLSYGPEMEYSWAGVSSLPDEFFLTIPEYFEKNNLTDLATFARALTGLVYQDIQEQIAATLLKMISWSDFQDPGYATITTAGRNNSAVWASVANVLGESVFLDAEITSVSRNGNDIKAPVSIKAQTPAGSVSIKAKKVLQAYRETLLPKSLPFPSRSQN